MGQSHVQRGGGVDKLMHVVGHMQVCIVLSGCWEAVISVYTWSRVLHHLLF